MAGIAKALAAYKKKYPDAISFKTNVAGLDWRRLYEVMYQFPQEWDTEDIVIFLNKEITPWTEWDWTRAGKQVPYVPHEGFYASDVYISLWVWWLFLRGKRSDTGDDFKKEFYTKAHVDLFEWGNTPATKELKFYVFTGPAPAANPVGNIYETLDVPNPSRALVMGLFGNFGAGYSIDYYISGASLVRENGDISLKQTDHELGPRTTDRLGDANRWSDYSKRGGNELRVIYGSGDIDEEVSRLLAIHKKGKERTFLVDVRNRMEEFVKNEEFELTPGWSDQRAVGLDKEGKPQLFFQPRKNYWSNDDIDPEESVQIRRSITSFLGINHLNEPNEDFSDIVTCEMFLINDNFKTEDNRFMQVRYTSQVPRPNLYKRHDFAWDKVSSEEFDKYNLIQAAQANEASSFTSNKTYYDQVNDKDGKYAFNTYNYMSLMGSAGFPIIRKVPNQPAGLEDKDFQQIQNFYNGIRGTNQTTWMESIFLKGETEFGWKGDTLFLILRRTWDNLKINLKDVFIPALGKDTDEIKKRYGSVLTILDVYNEYVEMCAEALAFQFLTVSHAVEVVKFWTELNLIAIREAKNNDTRNLTENLIKEAAERAKDADRIAFDNNAGAAAEDSELKQLDPEDIEQRQKFLKQCALLMNLERFKLAYQREFKKTNPLRYKLKKETIIHTLDVDQSSNRSKLINKLLTSPEERISAFLNATPEIQSSLVPKMRFYKVYNDDKGELQQVEFSFPKYYNSDDKIYSLKHYGDKKGVLERGGSGGIKSFTWKFEGTTPATARNDIEADLVLYFDNFNELLKTRTNDDLFSGVGDSMPFRYIDLLLLGDVGEKPDISRYDPKNHRIKVDVGWSIRRDPMFDNIVSPRGVGKLNEALTLMNRSYYLNMIDHDLNFKDDGSVEVKISYRAYLETAMKSSNLDALMTPQLLKEKANIKEEYDKILEDKVCSDADNRKRFEELNSIYSAIETQHKKRSHQSLIQRLVEKDRLHYCIIDKKDTISFKRNGFFSGPPRIIFPASIKVKNNTMISTSKQLEADGDNIISKTVFLDSSLAKLDSVSTKPSDSQELVTFFYIGDLINVILDCLVDPGTDEIFTHLKNTKILLSSLDYIDNSNKLRNINISEIPVATEYFFEWMNDNVIKIKKRSYPVGLFIRDLCNKLIVDLLMEQCMNRETSKQLHFHTMPLTALGKWNGDKFNDPFLYMKKIPTTNHIDISAAYNASQLPLKTEIPNRQIHGMYNYYLVHPVTDDKVKDGTGNFDADASRGVYHLGVGLDRGIVKKIKFTKTDIQYLREARYFNHGADGLAQLSAVYKATIEMFGNTLFYPGMEIFIDPRYLAGHTFDPTESDSTANTLGIGGYHLITRVENSIGPGKFNTTVEALFVYSGDGGISSERGGDLPIQEKPQTLLRVDSVKDACDKITFLRQQNFELGINDLETNYAALNEEELDQEINKKNN